MKRNSLFVNYGKGVLDSAVRIGRKARMVLLCLICVWRRRVLLAVVLLEQKDRSRWPELASYRVKPELASYRVTRSSYYRTNNPITTLYHKHYLP